MSVIMWPGIAPQSAAWELRSLTAVSRSPLSGVVTTLERPGAHWALRAEYSSIAGSSRARMQTFLAAARGHAQRFYVPVYGWIRRGSFPASELLTNNTFSAGTSGWTPSSNTVLSAQDGELRLIRRSGAATVFATQSVSVTPYVPYAMRVLTHYATPAETLYGASVVSGSAGTGSFASSPGMQTAVIVSLETSATAYVDQSSSYAIGAKAGDYRSVSYTSLARCALVDNGPNAGARANELENSYWGKQQVSIATGYLAPDGTTSARRIVESTSNGPHYVWRYESRVNPGAPADYCMYCYLARGAGSAERDLECILGADSSNYVAATFVLSGVAAGTLTNVGSVGSASNARAFIVDASNGYYFCALVGRLPAGTEIRREMVMRSAGQWNYIGDGTSSIAAWRCGWAQTSVPTRGMHTTDTPDSDGVPQSGSALYLRGLPQSGSGLLLPGDPVEIITPAGSQLVRVRAPLNSDAAGLGLLEFEPPLRASPQDGAGVIIVEPMCSMLMEENAHRWTDRVGGVSSLEFSAVEDIAS